MNHINLVEGQIRIIGKQGDDRTTVAHIPIKKWKDMFPEAEIRLLVQSHGCYGTYIPLITETSGDEILWTITSSDLSYVGIGKCLLDVSVGDDRHIVGTETDTGMDTICGCVNTTLDRIEALYPAHMPIGIISPLPCACVDTSVNLHPVQNPADDSCRMAQFVEQLSLICKHRGIPFLDLFHQSNLRPWHQECNAKYFSCESAKTGDGLHPNGHGHRLIYRQILDFVQKIVI